MNVDAFFYRGDSGVNTLWYQDEHYGVLEYVWKCSGNVPESLRVADSLDKLRRAR